MKVENIAVNCICNYLEDQQVLQVKTRIKLHSHNTHFGTVTKSIDI